MSRIPDYIFCGDDFTGASDTLATLARAGLRCRLFLSPESLLQCRELSTLDAVGIATASRSMKPDALVAELQEVGHVLQKLGSRIFHYKVCSTFDSSPETGSIGVAINALKPFLPDAKLVIVGGQPSLKRYCVFSHLFAAGTDGGIHRIDRHPTMANHPVTPMREADLRRLLAAQGVENVHGIHPQLHGNDREGVRLEALKMLNQARPVLFDACEQADLEVIGQLLHESQSIFAVGSSSVAESYLIHRAQKSEGRSRRKGVTPQKPVFILAGSRSQATAMQVSQAHGFSKLTLAPADIQKDRDAMLSWLTSRSLELLSQGRHVLAVVSEDMDHTLSRVDLALFTAELAAAVVGSGQIDRLGIAGGDTSSLALQQLGVESLSYGADIEPGLCLCTLHSRQQPASNGLEVVLKGGQMGKPDLFMNLTGPL